MLGKAWGWLTARLGGQPQGRLRFSGHRHPAYPSFWRPSDQAQGTPRLEIQIHLEASNMTNQPRWITSAEIERGRRGDRGRDVLDLRGPERQPARGAATTVCNGGRWVGSARLGGSPPALPIAHRCHPGHGRLGGGPGTGGSGPHTIPTAHG